ncbi:uncharacterized protein LOC135080416 [Ostrinia nubilalis]|uniref:uncharacterized protein LOC135080416 n=1 Tax=Ostrinia nubilalis TaxID=29057 RepID=UPI00308254CA
MSKHKSNSMKMVATKSKNNVISCSTPEHQVNSPSRDSDSMCDSDAGSPVPFLCTQDGAEGETDVIWNFYTPKSGHAASSRCKNSTPLSRKAKKSFRPKVIEKPPPKRRPIKALHKQTELFQELLELNQKLPELMKKKAQPIKETRQSGSEDDIFNDSPEHSPKTGLRNTRCLRKNLLSSKFSKPEIDNALESDDSMNECLLKASQIVEENLLECRPSSPKRSCYESHYKSNKKDMKLNTDFKIDQDSMDAILNSIKLESPAVSKVKKFESPKLGNDSFDSFVGNLNDSALEQLTQMPIKGNVSASKAKQKSSDWTLKEFIVHEGSPSSKSVFGRYSSMPESPSVIESNKPSTSGMAFGRYNSMPFRNDDNLTAPGDSPIRCTPDEIKRKHQMAREKLLAKRQLPFTSSQQSTQSTQFMSEPLQRIPKNTKFQPRIPSTAVSKSQNSLVTNAHNSKPATNNDTNKNNNLDLKSLIEKKRQEALMKLRRRQPK